MNQIYEKLRDRLNSLAFGYGATDTGAELTLLKRFFTPKDAAYVLELEIDKFFTAAEYADRSGRTQKEAEKILDDLSMKGLIFRKRRENEITTYRVVPFAHGVIEFRVDDLAKDIEEGKADWLADYGEHVQKIWGKQWFGSSPIPFFRAVPIETKLVNNGEILPYDDAESIIKSKKLFAVSKCLCRVNTAATGGYDDPRKETCIAFDDMAQFYIDIGIGRQLTMQEAIDIVEESIDLGLCIHVANSKDSEVMCSCHVDRCGLLQMTKAFGGAATAHVSHYKIDVDNKKCTACGTCVEICPTECCFIENEVSSYETDRCLGCGQCVVKCPSNARVLVKKDDSEIIDLQDTIFEAYEEMQRIRKASGEI